MESVKKINKKVLCTLERIENSKEIRVNYVKIDKNSYDYQTELKYFFNQDDKCSVEDLYKCLSSHKKMRIFFKDYDYCRFLGKAYQGVEGVEKEFLILNSEIIKREKEILKEKKQKRKRKLINQLEKEIIKSKNILYDEIRSEFKVLHKAYRIKKTYKSCENNQNIIAFSHRKVGWNYPKYSINKNFSFVFDVNFGYGKSSYFYTKIAYKGIEIVPFADLVLYRQAHFAEIIKYSDKYRLENREWLNAMEYVKDAYNMSINDEKAFYEKYIVSQLDDLINGLYDIFNFEQRKGWKFLNKEKDFVDLNESEHNLIEFKGEKVSEALGFVKILNIFKKNILDYEDFNLDGYIDEIEGINKKIKPVILKEKLKIKEEITQLKNKNKELKKELKKLNKNLNKLYKKRKVYIKTVKAKNKEVLKKDLKKKFKKENPNFNIWKKKVSEKSEIKAANKVLLTQKENTFKNLKEYYKKILKYFKKKNRKLLAETKETIKSPVHSPH